jgi:ACS family tartrate transporter-like MFS transporter
MDDAARKAILGKVSRRLIPFLFLLYVVNILDRVNVGFARLQMLDELQMGEDVYALGAGIFYLGYVICEVPSNLMLRRTGARRWIARIMISWGLVTCAMMAVRGPWTFYLLRILLGIAEAGFFPGIIFYLTYWFPGRDRARIVALFMAGSPITGMVGNPLSGAILQGLDQVGGLSGWQWLFLLEGVPAVILGAIALYYLTDRPEEASWLTTNERNWLVDEMHREEKHVEQHHGLSLGQAVMDRRVWLLILIYFTVAVGSNALGFYLPALIDNRFPGINKVQIGMLASVPYVCAVIVMVLNGAHSDRTGERRWHMAVPAVVAACGLTLYALSDSPALGLLGLALAQSGVMSMLPVFWTVPPSFLSGVAAAGGIALINSVGNVGGFVGPNFIGQPKELTGSFTPGLLATALTLCIGAVLALRVRQDQGRQVDSA